MFSPFFKLAAVSPGRQLAFRYLVGCHLILVTAGIAMPGFWLAHTETTKPARTPGTAATSRPVQLASFRRTRTCWPISDG